MSNKNIEQLREELKIIVQKLNLEKIIDRVNEYQRLPVKKLDFYNRRFLGNFQQFKSLLDNSKGLLDYHILNFVYAKLVEYALRYTNKHRGEDKKFEHYFLAAFASSFNLSNSLEEPVNATQTWLRMKKSQAYMFGNNYFYVLSRLIYIFIEIPELIKKGKLPFGQMYDLEKTLKIIEIDIKSYLYILLLPHFIENNFDNKITLDDILNPEKGVKLPADGEDIKNTFNTLCWTREKQKNHDGYKSIFSKYPLIPLDKNSKTHYFLFKDLFINNMFDNIYLYLLKKDKNLYECFRTWLGDAIEHYVGVLLKDCCSAHGVEVFNTKKIREKIGVSIKKGNESIADFMLIQENIVVLIEVKIGVMIKETMLDSSEKQTVEENEERIKSVLKKALGQIENTYELLLEKKEYKKFIGIIVNLESTLPQAAWKEKMKKEITMAIEWGCCPLHILEYLLPFLKSNRLKFADFVITLLKAIEEPDIFILKMRKEYGDSFQYSPFKDCIEKFLQDLAPGINLD